MAPPPATKASNMACPASALKPWRRAISSSERCMRAVLARDKTGIVAPCGAGPVLRNEEKGPHRAGLSWLLPYACGYCVVVLAKTAPAGTGLPRGFFAAGFCLTAEEPLALSAMTTGLSGAFDADASSVMRRSSHANAA